ncbi:hypothetical protein EMPS_03266 [Entomortierella parvispora]|uniref:FAR-17a/AIG1-like protein n=1 Tax=Entomortierella parvispora TaxID=205924 RepID=A0A9P3LU90_9FUNG|nr:hypothetical protein EMPS_03266 [Entomortierella parvispora]
MSRSPTPSSVFSLTFSSDGLTDRLQESSLLFRKTRSGSKARPRVPSYASTSNTLPPLYRLKWKKIIFHFACISSALGAGLKLASLQTKGTKRGFGFGSQYLTILGLVMTIGMFLLALFVDFTQSSRARRIKNTLLPLLVTIECAIGAMYWLLVMRDVFHIYPDGNRYIPFWVDIQVHGLPFFYTLVEMFFISESFQVRRKADIINMSGFAVFYMCWSSFCAHMDGEWPYPVLQNITCPWTRLQMMTICSLSSVFAHIIITEAHVAHRARVAVKAMKGSKDLSQSSIDR